MTVIREKQNYNYPKANSVAASDTESLHLGSVSASDTESLNDEPFSTNRVYRIRSSPRSPMFSASQIEDLISIRKSTGKKKLRRYQNRCSLQTWNEKEEDEENFFVIMESYQGPFSRLLQDKNALEYWNDFIEKSEDEQAEILKALSKTCDDLPDSTNKVEKHGRISARIKRIIKIKKNLSTDLIRGCEDELISFFKTTPEDIYTKITSNSFDRILLHGIAQYHMLKSISIQKENCTRRSVEVYNTDKNWAPAECFLADSLKHLRK